MLSKCQLLMIIFVLAFMVYSDYIDFSREMLEQKFAVSGMAVLFLMCVLKSHQSKVFKGMAEITREKLLVSTVAQESRLSSMQTKIVSVTSVSPVQFAKALCDERLRMSLRFSNQAAGQDHLLNTTDLLGSTSSYTNQHQDLENQGPVKVKKDIWGTFDHGHVAGGVYRLEQDESIF